MRCPTSLPRPSCSNAGRPFAALILLTFLWQSPALVCAQEINPQGPREKLRASVAGIHERKSSIYCSCNNIEGRDLVFDLLLENFGDSALEAYIFVWAANDEVDPPERGLWPVSAVDDALTESGDLDVRVPRAGHRVLLSPNQEFRIEDASILQPIGWADGALVRFTKLRIQAWSEDGRPLLDLPFELDMLFD